MYAQGGIFSLLLLSILEIGTYLNIDEDRPHWDRT